MKIKKTQEEWREQLSPQSYHVCREHGTEAPFSGEYNDNKEEGIYKCICCHTPLFISQTKFDSGTGWPSFYDSVENAIDEISDTSLGMVRVEVRCKTCDSHLGHQFPDGPEPTHLRYCINSLSLEFSKSK